MFNVNIFIILIFLVLNNGQANVPQKLFLSVYYESLCPDSKAFVLQQLQPAFQLMPEHLLLRLVPFGKAKSIDDGYSGFECQHGPSECLGNIVQECALDLMSNRSDAQKVAYVACEMATFAGARGSLECVQKSKISSEAVNECVSSGKGTSLQLDSEYFTKLVRPSFVPTVTIDSIFNQQIQDSAQVDLIGTICSILKETRKCAQHYNNMAMKNPYRLNQGNTRWIQKFT